MAEPRDLTTAIELYSQNVLAAARKAPKPERGLFVMTAHQVKGKEFDAIVHADAIDRFWPDDDESRRLFYVLITRATASWAIIATDPGASPLLRHLVDS